MRQKSSMDAAFMDKRWWKSEHVYVFKASLIDCLLVETEQKPSAITLSERTKLYFDQVIKINITSEKQMLMCLQLWCPEKCLCSLTYVVCWLRVLILNPIKRKIQNGKIFIFQVYLKLIREEWLVLQLCNKSSLISVNFLVEVVVWYRLWKKLEELHME